MPYDELEKVVYECLGPYEYKELGEVEPFDQTQPTIENMGSVFFDKLKIALESFPFRLVKLEISETPSRTYIVSPYDKSLKKEKVKHLLIENILSNTSKAVMQDALGKNQVTQKIYSSEPFENQTQLINMQDNVNKAYNQTDGAEIDIKNNTESNIKNNIGISANKTKTYFNTLFLNATCAVLVLAAVASFLLIYIKQIEGAPWGADIYGHI